MAQIGSRLIDATAGKITDDFFKAFEGAAASRAGSVALAFVSARAGRRRPSARAPLGWAGWAPSWSAPRPICLPIALTPRKRPQPWGRPLLSEEGGAKGREGNPAEASWRAAPASVARSLLVVMNFVDRRDAGEHLVDAVLAQRAHAFASSRVAAAPRRARRSGSAGAARARRPSARACRRGP